MANTWKTRLNLLPAEDWKRDRSWEDRTIAQRLDVLCETDPARILVVDGRRSLSAGEIRREALRLRAGLADLGLVPGSVVSFQLPNWHEVMLIDLACAYGGFVCNPIVPIYREAEVSHILQDAGSEVFIVPHVFRKFDYAAMARRIRSDASLDCRIAAVRGFDNLDAERFEGLFAPEKTTTTDDLRPVDPDSVKLLMYTSGTTGRAKGVLHSHNTIGAEIRHFIEYLKLDEQDVILMPSPLSHITGYLYGVQLPITMQGKVVLMDTWDVGLAADLIEEHRVTFTIGATPFLQELGSFAGRSGRTLPSLRFFASGGAPVPPEIVERANAAFANCACFRLYGSTEAPTVTLGVPDRARADLAASTEGFVVGHEIRLIGLEGQDARQGEEGEIATRGPEVCLGYADDTQNLDAFDPEGYFRTGDLARMSPEGCLVITGRKKDLIIRGGENLSPKEIEDEIYKLPAVKDAAVVAMPHARLGETACAFVVLHDGQSLDLRQLVDRLDRSGLARQKFPERLEIVRELPYTAAGKVRKDLLRAETSKFRPAGKAIDENG